MDYEENIQRLGLELPPVPPPAGLYQPVVETGDIAYLSGQISKTATGQLLTGRVGAERTLCQGQEAAEAAALNVLSIIRNLIGFRRFLRLLRVNGYVQVAPDFYEIPQVLNAASELFLRVLGENGAHARSAVGVASLPLNASVELEVTVALRGSEKEG